jgi:uncharacterized protein
MHALTPISALVGGALIALSLAIPLLASGRVAGLSGIVAGLARGGDRAWRASFVIGAVATGAIALRLAPATFDHAGGISPGLAAGAGLLVGLGTRLGSGCTSGHGICGVSRLSPRSLAATATFFVVAVATATLVGGRA